MDDTLTIGRYNAAQDLIERNLAAGRADKIAYIDDDGSYTYGELAARVRRFASALRQAGIAPEQRILLCLEDSINFPTAFLGALWAGVIPVPVNTLLTSDDYAYMLAHARARAVFVDSTLYETVATAANPLGIAIITPGGRGASAFEKFIAEDTPPTQPYHSNAHDIAFWLYSSGSTGRPKGAVHVHGSLNFTAEKFARSVLGLRGDDTVYSASKLFFAYGLGNGLTFPLSVGATTVLTRRRPTADTVFDILKRHRATVFYGVPTLFAAMLASEAAPRPDELCVRVCTSAGEGLPHHIGESWTQTFGSEILDGIGSTEMLHIFLSNRPGAVRYGTTGLPVDGYELKLVDESGAPVGPGELGDLWVRGPSSALMYWADRRRSDHTFQDGWTRTGDKYSRDADGYYVYGGRSDDMLKVGGIYVSPFEVESALVSHPLVLEAAVIGAPDERGLIKPKAYAVLRQSCAGEEADRIRETLRAHVKSMIAPFKSPRWIEFVEELPKTATGKVQRYRLRELIKPTPH